MRRRVLFALAAMLFTWFDLASSQTGVLVLKTPNIRTVPSESLDDLAVAIATPGDPVILYNPRLMARFGPDISAFVLAHEAAHILLEHRRPNASRSLSRAEQELLQSWELEADCAAAIRLARERPAALE